MTATAPLTAADYEVIIGLEVHVQLKTNTKMFCGCKNEFGGASNSHVCPVCLGLPGVLPVPNEEAIVKTILTGEMLDCQIATRCKFDRKNYFYPDMPKNYQISQYDEPLCLGGVVRLDLLAYPKDAQKDSTTIADKPVRLTRIHLEEDVAKSFHHDDGTSGIDFNRAGTPLMEIVSEADMSTAEEAFAYLSALKETLIYCGVSDADMEKGQMRCDVNISIRPHGQQEYGTKCELKNLNSISGVRRALKYEIARQIEVVTSGGTIRQETRRWDDVAGETTLMRIKEKAHDYRYFPDPDLQPVRTDTGLHERALKQMPRKREELKKDLEDLYHLPSYQAWSLISTGSNSNTALQNPYIPPSATVPTTGTYLHSASSGSITFNYFKEGIEQRPQYAAQFANLFLNDYMGIISGSANPPEQAIPPYFIGQLAEMTGNGQINSRQAKEILKKSAFDYTPPAQIAQSPEYIQLSDTGALEAFCDQAIAANPKSVADFKAGKLNAVNALKGQVMKLSKGTANPTLVGDILVRKLSS
jgi:aspartyl-tRNA(Asn)/glutamyl-tRNA(Gln) amidotransferase subunit B